MTTEPTWETPRTDAAEWSAMDSDGEYTGMIVDADLARAIERDLARMTAERDRLREVLELPLLFHAGGEWTKEMSQRWIKITGEGSATTKVMCDSIRAARSESAIVLCSAQQGVPE